MLLRRPEGRVRVRPKYCICIFPILDDVLTAICSRYYREKSSCAAEHTPVPDGTHPIKSQAKSLLCFFTARLSINRQSTSIHEEASPLSMYRVLTLSIVCLKLCLFVYIHRDNGDEGCYIINRSLPLASCYM